MWLEAEHVTHGAVSVFLDVSVVVNGERLI